ncbi:MAG: TetR family transcriptional regulator C-terminal domain-containing protein [Aquabacterium sp.]
MPRTADKTDIPNRLTEAGYALFKQHGYNATGIQQITDQAGVPKGSFYNHFESKEAFAAQIIRNYAQWVENAWHKGLQDAPASPLATIRQLFAMFIAHHAQSGCQGCLVGNFAAEVVEASPHCRSVLSAVMQDWRGRLAMLIAQAQQAGELREDLDAQTMAGFFWDAWEGALLRTKVDNSVQPLEDALRLMLDKFFIR